MHVALPHIRQAITSMPWAILPERATDIAAVIERRLLGERLTPEAIEAIKGPRSMPNGMVLRFTGGAIEAFDDDDERAQRSGTRHPAAQIAAVTAGGSQGGMVGVINVFGVIAQHARQVDDVSGPGGTSCERIAAAVRAAVNDPNITAIVFNIDSPGGSVFGVQALGDLIFASRGKKPMVAQANSLCASAAYWIASACDEIVVTPGGQVGSIGVVALHEDASVMLDKMGVKYTYIHAGKYKVEGNSVEPLGEEARSAIQADVDAYYRDFVRAVARNRGVAVKEVLDGFGEARCLKDMTAVSENLADRVATLDDTLQRMLKRGATKGPRGMAAGFSAEELSAQETLLAPPAEGPADDAQGRAPDAPASDAPPPPPPPPAATPEAPTAPESGADTDAAARDAYRRRRHAHLMRRSE